MTTLMRNRMRRHTRPAKFMSRAHKAESMSWGRPGNSSFSFSGEFPSMGDQQPVEAGGGWRHYTSGRSTGSYHPVRQDETRRMPVINKHGVHVVTALAMLAVMFVILGSVFLVRFNERADVLSSINARHMRIEELTADCAKTRNDIATQSNDVNIRQEAVRMGLVSSKGVAVEYLEVPADAVITLKDQTAIQSLASIWSN